MQMNPFGTLQGKFTVCLSALIVVIMSGLSFWAISREKGLMENAIMREGKALVESFAISCTNTMLYEEIGLVDEGGLLDNYISDLMQRKDLPINYAMILNPAGHIIAHSSPAEVGTTYNDPVTTRALSSWNTLMQHRNSDLLDISTPLAISSKRWGTLRIGISLQNLQKEIPRLVWGYVLYTAAFIVLAIAVIGLLFGLITRPLKLLSEEMVRMTIRNDAPTLPLKGQDEIGALQQRFHSMVKSIRADEEERERTQRNLLLTEKMAAIGKLTSGLAHEINNPLGGILNCIYHFKRGVQSADRQREYLDLMEDGVRRIQKRVTDLLEYARNPKLEISSTDISPLIEKSLTLLEYQMKKNLITVERNFAEAVHPVELDRDQMGQVFVNIFLNAVQAMPEGGTLGIDVRTVDKQLVVTVSDTGKGIPDEILPKIFDPFFTTKAEEKGTGLGLWLSQKIIERHGGTIRIKGREKEGAIVSIELPLIFKGAL